MFLHYFVWVSMSGLGFGVGGLGLGDWGWGLEIRYAISARNGISMGAYFYFNSTNIHHLTMLEDQPYYAERSKEGCILPFPNSIGIIDRKFD